MIERRRWGYRQSAGLFVVTLAVSSCRAILGIDEDYYNVGGGAGGLEEASNLTTSGAGRTGSASSTTTTTVAASSSSGAGGAPGCTVTHPGGGECEYLPAQECGCSSTEKCSVTNEATGQSSCILAGNLGTAQKCSSDGDCKAGLWCDHFTSTCAKICDGVTPCPQGGKCIQAAQLGKGAIPGLRTCTANCEPITASPCGPELTCEFDSSLDVEAFDCFVSGLKTEGQACTISKDCNKGLVCLAGTSANTCERWCTPVSTSFPAKANNCTTAKPRCVAFSNHFTRDGVEYGVCAI